jgi:hypothetical protein
LAKRRRATWEENYTMNSTKRFGSRMLKTAALAAVLACAAAPVALAQAAPGYQPPRNAWGKPDFEGNWTNATVTGMARPAGLPLELTPEQAAKLEGGALINVRSAQKDAAYVDPKDGAPEKGKPLPGVGNYDVAYTDPGTKVMNINGSLRSSFITFPEDGRIPALTENGKTLRTAAFASARRGTGFDNPEERGLAERCIIIGNAGPPLGTYLYNNNFQIVQTPDNLVLVSEMIHDARTMRIGGKPRTDGVDAYHGDSVAHWDGDTLVVETTGMNYQQRAGRVFVSKEGKIVEKFTRISATQILYDFEVNDPSVYTSVWRGQEALTKMDKPLFEYACAEGNYALPGILSGGRNDDKKGVVHKPGGARGE